MRPRDELIDDIKRRKVPDVLIEQLAEADAGLMKAAGDLDGASAGTGSDQGRRVTAAQDQARESEKRAEEVAERIHQNIEGNP